MRKFTFLMALVLLTAFKLSAQTTLVPFGSTWKYLDNGSNQGSAWRSTTFDDTSWKSGPAILGYGNPINYKEATLVSYGPDPNNTYITTYFRKAISLPSAYTSVMGKIKRDDGAVVYVNGVEVYRSNLPSGSIVYNTTAYYASDNGTQAQSFTIPGSAFTGGINVIAVEVHQHSKTSSDMAFDLELIGSGGTAPADQTPPTVLSLNRLSPTTETTSATSVTFRATFSEAVTGVDATDFALALGGSATGTVASAAAVGTGATAYDITVNGISGSGTLGLNLKSSGTGIQDAAANPISGGFTGQTYTTAQTPADQTPPTMLSLNRLLPTTETTSATSVTFRATFSEAVTGVDATDFALALGGETKAIMGAVTPFGNGGTTYDISVTGVNGNGTLGLNLKGSDTGITDAAVNAISGGFTGQTYTINQAPAGGNTTLFTFGSTWKYLDNGSNQGTAWQGTAFNDGSWKTGNGKFGYGYNNEATMISFGPDPTNKYITTYFRKAINITNASAFTSFTGNVKRDDGVVVYVNGVEVYRNNLPDGTITYTTLAFSATDNGSTPQTFIINTSAFVTGTNVIAVEVHQTGRDSFDMGFDLELIGNGGTAPADQTPPTVLSLNRLSPTTETTSATSVTFRATFSEAVTGVDATDFALALGGSATGTVASVAPVGTSATAYDITVNGISGSGTLGLNLKSSGTGIQDAAANPISGGFTGQTYTTAQTPADQTPPTMLSLNRLLPTTETTSATSVTFRATFSEAVTGVDATDFALALGGSATGTVASAAAVGTGATAYDVTVNGISGSGTLGLNLKNSGTGIQDAAANLIAGGFTGQAYTINPPPTTTYGFASVINLNPIISQSDATKARPQAKVFTNAGRHWAVIAAAGGTYLWRLDGRSWTSILRLSSRNARADCIVDGNVTHIFLFAGKSSELVSVEYVSESETYVPWTKRKTKVDLILDDGVETGTIARDGTGRLWLASDAVTNINIRYSDAPYTTWSAPITIGTGVSSDDICAVIAMPGKIGVLWGNQQTQRFGFKTHTDGQVPATWSADEVPASQSALNEGKGMADDHLDMKITSDGTLYCAVKTGYDQVGFTKIGLLVRRPTGTWDNLYGVSEYGTAPIVVVNEALGKVKVIYTSQTYGGDILYKESSMSSISFGRELTLISGIDNYPTASHQLYSSDVVILAGDTEQVAGVLASDVLKTSPALRDTQAARQVQVATAINPAEKNQQELQAYPNPFTSEAKIRFTLPRDGQYTLTLYNSKMGQVYQKQGTAKAGKQNALEIEGSGLSGGLYYARLQTNESVKTLKLILYK